MACVLEPLEASPGVDFLSTTDPIHAVAEDWERDSVNSSYTSRSTSLQSELLVSPRRSQESAFARPGGATQSLLSAKWPHSIIIEQSDILRYLTDTFDGGEFHNSSGPNSNPRTHGSSSSATFPSKVAARRQRAPLKQSSDGHGDPEDSSDERGRDKKRKCLAGPVQDRQRNRFFACPFTKYDPDHYQRCSSCAHSSIRRLKQHLYAVHSLPKHYCSRCFLVFNGVEALVEHEHAGRTCAEAENPYQQAMTDQQRERIAPLEGSCRSPGSEACWYNIYQILFPGAPLPVSPYLERHTSKEGTPRDQERLTTVQRRSVIAAARREVLLTWTAHELVLGVQRDFLDSFATAVENVAPSTGKAGATAQTQTDVTQSSRKTGRQDCHQRKRQKLIRRDDADEEESESEKSHGPPDVGLEIMCPYCWYDCETFSWRNTSQNEYRHCEAVKLESIARLKQHLCRVHKRPDFYCGRCFVVLESQGDVVTHLRQDPPCPIVNPERFTEKMTADQWLAIKAQRFSGPIEQSFKTICEILFPDEPPPLSPYRIARLVPSRPFLRRRLPGILTAIFQRRNFPMPAEGLDDMVNEVIRSLEVPEQAIPVPNPHVADLNVADTDLQVLGGPAVNQFPPDAFNWEDLPPLVVPDDLDDIFDQDFDHHTIPALT
ncbi:hypothetical protein G647_05426 [Cladophialophora carrionii CBS 160.54]|uniref:C2H2-type domain-containing protein n=1 Tax=Cladophialophora carrionii CBS 160.54 TaxID=1279043 RepID=V9D9L7_9EURO|nr:uncharacterized protein G647_05426 [Cladophialophora carrionii CBS 160.54]ETI23624.1 hypothetical protein G647_05426 [Cladophialophora carrionii CBS 160.54]